MSKKRRWVATLDTVVKHTDGQVSIVKCGETVAADKKPSRHFEPAPADKEKQKPVATLQEG